MFILERLISRGSRSLGAMLGTSRRGAGHTQGGRESSTDDDSDVRSRPALSPALSRNALIAPPALRQQTPSSFPAGPEHRAILARTGLVFACPSRKEKVHG